MPHQQALSTDHFALRDRAPVWHDWVRQQFGGLQSDLYGDSDFEGHLHTSQAGALQLTHLEAKRHRVTRTTDLARHTDEAFFKIVAPIKGYANVEQGGRQTSVHPGSWTVYDTTRPYRIANPGSVEHLVVMIPQRDLQGNAARLEHLMARPINGQSGIGRVALTTMRSTFEELPHMSADAALGGTLCIALSADATPGQVERAMQAGFDAYWTKPLDILELAGRLADALAQHGGR